MAGTEDHVVAVAGDFHGNTGWALARILDVAARGVSTLLHVGDFGIWPGDSGAKYLRKVERACADLGLSILVTPGNHEDWGRLTTRWENPKNRDGSGRLVPLHLTEHVTVLPRGHRWEMGGRTFVSLGGAASVDYQRRIEGRTWWREEIVTETEAEACAADGYADVMIAHETPDAPFQVPEVAAVLDSNPFGFSLDALAYSATSRGRVTTALLGIQPRLLIHGHMHVSGQVTVGLPDRDHNVTIWSLNCDRQAGNLRYLDLNMLAEAQDAN